MNEIINEWLPTHITNARIMLEENSERSFVNETLAGLLADLEAKDKEIERLKVTEGSAMLVIEQQDLNLKRSMTVVEAARNVQFKPQNDEPYLALQATIKALDNKK